jgi:hypothetical protein
MLCEGVVNQGTCLPKSLCNAMFGTPFGKMTSSALPAACQLKLSTATGRSEISDHLLLPCSSCANGGVHVQWELDLESCTDNVTWCWWPTPLAVNVHECHG